MRSHRRRSMQPHHQPVSRPHLGDLARENRESLPRSRPGMRQWHRWWRWRSAGAQRGATVQCVGYASCAVAVVARHLGAAGAATGADWELAILVRRAGHRGGAGRGLIGRALLTGELVRTRFVRSTRRVLVLVLMLLDRGGDVEPGGAVQESRDATCRVAERRDHRVVVDPAAVGVLEALVLRPVGRNIQQQRPVNLQQNRQRRSAARTGRGHGGGSGDQEHHRRHLELPAGVSVARRARSFCGGAF